MTSVNNTYSEKLFTFLNYYPRENIMASAQNDENLYKIIPESALKDKLYRLEHPFLFLVNIAIPEEAHMQKSKSMCEKKHFYVDKINVIDIVHIKDLDYWNDETFCKLMTYRHNGALRYCKKRTNNVYMNAVQKDGDNLRYVPSELQTYEMCLIAVRNNGLSIQYVDKVTDEMQYEAVKNNGMALRYIKNRTPELCWLAVKNTGCAIKHVPKEIQTEKLCIMALSENISQFDYIHNKTDILYRIASSYTKQYICPINIFINNVSMMTEDMLYMMVKNVPYVINYNMSQNILNMDIVKNVLKINHKCFKFIDAKYQTREICDYMLNIDGLYYCYIKNKELRNEYFDTVIKLLEYQYTEWNLFALFYEEYIEQHSDTTIEGLLDVIYEHFTIEQVKEIVKCYHKILNMVYYHIADIDFKKNAQHIFDEYNINYTNDETYTMSIMYGELDENHYKLIKSFAYCNTFILSNLFNGTVHKVKLQDKYVFDNVEIDDDGNVEYCDCLKYIVKRNYIIKNTKVNNIDVCTIEKRDNSFKTLEVHFGNSL